MGFVFLVQSRTLQQKRSSKRSCQAVRRSGHTLCALRFRHMGHDGSGQPEAYHNTAKNAQMDGANCKSIGRTMGRICRPSNPPMRRHFRSAWVTKLGEDAKATKVEASWKGGNADRPAMDDQAANMEALVPMCAIQKRRTPPQAMGARTGGLRRRCLARSRQRQGAVVCSGSWLHRGSIAHLHASGARLHSRGGRCCCCPTSLASGFINVCGIFVHQAWLHKSQASSCRKHKKKNIYIYIYRYVYYVHRH